MPQRYAGPTVVAATARLARALRREYDQECWREGLRVWDSPDFVSLDGWLARLWEECGYRDPLHTPLLLARWQERSLWEQAIAASDEDNLLLDRPATAAMAAEAWDLLHAWEIPVRAGEFEASRDTEAFLHWTRAVE